MARCRPILLAESSTNRRDDMFKDFELNAGTGMALGAILAAVVALLVNLVTGDTSIWAWAIPLGIALGVAVGAGRANKK